MVNIQISTKDLSRYERTLKTYTQYGHPFAVRNTLNDAAFGTMRRSKKRIDGQFVLRNSFTKRSIHVVRAKGLNINTMQSEIGSAAGYMADQEFGGVRGPGRGRSAVIPTTSASGQGINNTPRKRTVRSKFQLAKIALKTAKYRRKTKGMSDKQKAVVTAHMARREGDTFVYLNLPWGKKSRGIFEIRSFKRRSFPKIRLIHDMSRRRVPIKKSPWLNPSTIQEEPRLPRYYARRAREQLKRAGFV